MAKYVYAFLSGLILVSTSAWAQRRPYPPYTYPDRYTERDPRRPAPPQPPTRRLPTGRLNDRDSRYDGPYLYDRYPMPGRRPERTAPWNTPGTDRRPTEDTSRPYYTDRTPVRPAPDTSRPYYDEDNRNPGPTVTPYFDDVTITPIPGEIMANPRATTRPPEPPTYREGYVSLPDNTPAPTPTPPVTPPTAPAPLPIVASGSLLEMFQQGSQNKFRGCSIKALSRDRDNCQYEVIVEGRRYPFHNADVCSSNRMAAKVGCNYGNEQENIACVMKQALSAGYCH